MANKTIPELPEIDLVDLDDTQLLILEASVETYKLRLSTMLDFVFNASRRSVPVIYDGVETGVKTVDVSSYVADARTVIWMLKKPQATTDGEQIPAAVIKTPDADTVTIDSGLFAIDAGTYTLLGV